MKVCKLCGGPINNKYGYCRSNPQCAQLYYQAYREQNMPHCKHCGGLLYRNTLSGYCSRTPECNRLRKQATYERTKARKPKKGRSPNAWDGKSRKHSARISPTSGLGMFAEPSYARPRRAKEE